MFLKLLAIFFALVVGLIALALFIFLGYLVCSYVIQRIKLRHSNMYEALVEALGKPDSNRIYFLTGDDSKLYPCLKLDWELPQNHVMRILKRSDCDVVRCYIHNRDAKTRTWPIPYRKKTRSDLSLLYTHVQEIATAYERKYEALYREKIKNEFDKVDFETTLSMSKEDIEARVEQQIIEEEFEKRFQ